MTSHQERLTIEVVPAGAAKLCGQRRASPSMGWSVSAIAHGGALLLLWGFSAPLSFTRVDQRSQVQAGASRIHLDASAASQTAQPALHMPAPTETQSPTETETQSPTESESLVESESLASSGQATSQFSMLAHDDAQRLLSDVMTQLQWLCNVAIINSASPAGVAKDNDKDNDTDNDTDNDSRKATPNDLVADKPTTDKPPVIEPLTDEPPADKALAEPESSASASAADSQASAASEQSVGARVDQLPSPLATNVPPGYPYSALQKRLQGRVVLRVQVSRQGQVTSLAVHRSSGASELDQAALAAVKLWQFQPARRDSRPVPFTVDVPLRFTLPSQ